MHKLKLFQKWLPLFCAATALGIVVLDYFNGPDVAFPYLFIIPVTLAARFNGRRWGLVFALLLPLARPCLHVMWETSWDWSAILVNAVIRITVLAVAAVLIDTVTRQAQEIRVLKGVLPTCSFCKKIRTPAQQWEQMETYISKNSEAQFSHGICPDCAKEHYPDAFKEPSNNSGPPAKASQ